MQTTQRLLPPGAKKARGTSKKRKRTNAPPPATGGSSGDPGIDLFDDYSSSDSDSDEEVATGLRMANYHYDKANEDLDEAAASGDPTGDPDTSSSQANSNSSRTGLNLPKLRPPPAPWTNRSAYSYDLGNDGDGGDYGGYDNEYGVDPADDSVRQPATSLPLLSAEWREKWSRPPFDPPHNPVTDNLVFQLNEIDYTVVANNAHEEPQHTLIANDTVTKAPVLRLFGTTATGQSILALVYGFLPYCYIQVPNMGDWANLDDPDDRLDLCREMKTALETGLTDLKIPRHLEMPTPILAVEFVTGLPFKGYVDSRFKVAFFKVTTALPGHIPHVRTIAEKGFLLRGVRSCNQGEGVAYEADVPFTTRFQSDRQLKSCQWMKLPAGDYHVVESYARISHCSLEVMVSSEQVTPIPIAGEGSKQAPVRVLSFDIECVGKNGFPIATHDDNPVAQISGALKVYDGSDRPSSVRNVFCFRETSNLDKEGVDIHWYDTEDEMMQAWRVFVVTADPDIITGYNIANFDMQYIWNRITGLKFESGQRKGQRKMSQKTLMQSRIKQHIVQMRTQTFSSKARGESSSNSFSLHGRVVFDFYRYIRDAVKLRLYTLQYVVKQYLGEDESKEDMDYREIPALFAGTPDDRKRLAYYCFVDSLLVDKLVTKTLALVASTEMSRLTGVSLNDLFSRGQTLKVKTLIHQWIRKEQLEYFVPTRNREERDQASKASDGKATFEGAVVIEPSRGFYEIPIATLDFASLYPSIMLAHNLCFSTHISDPSIIERNQWVEDVHYVRTPAGHYFVTKQVREGVCPQILNYLIAERAAVRALIKNEKDKFTRDLLDQRQLAIKVAANSVYGFTGASTGPIFLRAISESVTAYGREMINKTRDLVVEKYSKKNGHPYDTEVIYGDTDSVMVKFGTSKLEEAIGWGMEAAVYVTGFFKKPISLTYEKCYAQYLLMEKKRYIGLKHEGYGIPTVDAKGVESVRRDNCTLVQSAMQRAIETVMYSRPAHVRDAAAKLVSELALHKLYSSGGGGERSESDKDKEGEKRTHTFVAKELLDALVVLKPGEKIQSEERMMLILILKRLPKKQTEVGADYLLKTVADSTPETALREVCEIIAKLRMNEVPYSQLSITKKFSKPANKYKNLQPHLEVNKKMQARGEPGYLSGDRIEYVITGGGTSQLADDGSVKLLGKWKVNVSSKAEDPKFAETNRIPLDLNFYTGMLIKPFGRLLRLIIPDVHKKLLFGPHMRRLRLATPAKVKGLITMFTQVLAKCSECKTGDLLAGQSEGGCAGCVKRSSTVAAAAAAVATPAPSNSGNNNDDDMDIDTTDYYELERIEMERKQRERAKKRADKRKEEEESGNSGGDFSVADLFAPRNGVSIIDKYFQEQHDEIPAKRRKV